MLFAPLAARAVPAGVGIRGADPNGPPYALPPLSYGEASLEPHLSGKVIKVLHDEVHASHVVKVNEAYQGTRDPQPLFKLQTQTKGLQPGVRQAVLGHYNYCLFFASMCPEDDSSAPGPVLRKAFDKEFGGEDGLQAAFVAGAKKVAASGGDGWVWLNSVGRGGVGVSVTTGESNPLAEGNGVPFLCLDLAKAAYAPQ